MEDLSTNQSKDWKQVRDIFEQVLQSPAQTRRQYARELCGSDNSLLQEIESLLASYESSDSFLETPAFAQVFEGPLPLNQLDPGKRLLHYEICELIGRGGMGEVYLARDTKLNRNVAIKLLRSDLVPQARTSDRLLREARAAALLEHPNICHIYEISEADNFHFIVMQYIVGTILDELLSKVELHIDTALDLGVQIATGLAEAHSHGIIHRDIKPANIIISEKNEAKILDFGLAKFIEVESRADTVSRMESTGGVMGTIPYMSPEQLSGHATDVRTDVFSLGSLLFEMISGSPAFRRERNEDTIRAILTEQPDWSVIAPALRPLLRQCLAKEPSDRYASASDVADSLNAARGRVTTRHLSRTPSAARNPQRIATDESEIRTAIHSISTQALDLDRHTGESEWDARPAHGRDQGPDIDAPPRSRSRFLALGRPLLGWVGVIAFSTGLLAYMVYSSWTTVMTQGYEKPQQRIYWELSYANKRKFVQNRIYQIQMMIGDDQRKVSDTSFDGILKEVDWYVSRRDSLTQEPFREGLRVIYGRASQYAPVVSAAFEKERVPTPIGIYQAMVESEYRDCLANDNGPSGLFQFTKATAQQYGLTSQDRCRIDFSSKAAAEYNAKLLRDLGGDAPNWTLAVLAFNQGEELTRTQIAALEKTGSHERSYWAISENQEVSANDPSDSDRYVRRFFAAAIIGENPEMFGLVTPPLSTIRTRVDLGIQSILNPLVSIPAGSFKMGRDIGPEFSRPNHVEQVEGFRMNKTEVTNSEFADFMSTTGYRPEGDENGFLAHWVNGFPIEFDQNTPVRFVNLADINAFIRWKSRNDGIRYRLPTETEWEYAARNGSKNNLYPWGDMFDARCAYIDQQRNEPVPVGSKTCPNMWGVQDLIGNVFEWTSSPPSAYPGGAVEIPPQSEPHFIIRGGGAFDRSTGPNAITSAFRWPTPASRRSAGLGFRLVADQ